MRGPSRLRGTTGAAHAMYQYRVYHTAPQATALDDQVRAAAELYNAALQERRDAWKTCRKSVNYYDQAKQLKAIRAEGLLALANFSCCQDVLWRVHETFGAFFARVKRGATPGFPRFRSARRYDSLTFPSYGDGCRLRANGRLYLQGIGELKVKLHRPVGGDIKTVTIKREAGRWFVCFSVTQSPAPLALSECETGIDVGLTSFAVLSDGPAVECGLTQTIIENPRHDRKAQARLRRCQRKVARRTKGSHRRRKAVRLLQRAKGHVAHQRADRQHKLARTIVKRYGRIAVEDLNIKGLAGGMLAKSVHDAGWSSFLNKIAYKAENAGRILVKVDPRGTSQTCLCGARVPKTLNERWHTCGVCGVSASRDQVSAHVILSRARTSGWNPAPARLVEPSGANVENRVSCVS